MPLKNRVVYSLTERNGKVYMRRIGAGHENPDGSLDLLLEALPADGRTIIVRRLQEEADGTHIEINIDF